MSDWPNGRKALNDFYGNPAGPDGQASPAWEEANLVVLVLPWAMTTTWDGTTVTKVRCHRKVQASLQRVLASILAQVRDALRIEAKHEIPVDEMQARMRAKYPGNDAAALARLVTGSYDQMVEARLMPRLRTLGLTKYGGLYEFRAIRGQAGLSTHSYGVAIDLDPEENALGAANGKMPSFVVAAFKAEGWTWGGDFKGRKDPMHFQAASGV